LQAFHSAGWSEKISHLIYKYVASEIHRARVPRESCKPISSDVLSLDYILHRRKAAKTERRRTNGGATGARRPNSAAAAAAHELAGSRFSYPVEC